MRETIQQIRREIIPELDEPVKTVLELYCNYCATHDAEGFLERSDYDTAVKLDDEISCAVSDIIYLRDSLAQDLDNIIKNPQYLQNLTIELPIQDIQNIWDEYSVIQLRPVGNNSKLLVGCGNNPANPLEVTQDDKKDKHQHEGYDTVNPSLLINPSIIASFGMNKGLAAVLPTSHYTVLATEAVTIMKDAKLFNQELFMQCFKENAYIQEIHGDVLPSKQERLMVSDIVYSEILFYEPRSINTGIEKG